MTQTLLEIKDITLEVFHFVSGSRGALLPFLLCVCYLLFVPKKEDEAARHWLAVPSAMLLLVFLNPTVITVLSDKESFTRVARFLWLLPSGLLEGYCFVRIACGASRLWQRAAFGLALLAVLSLHGQGLHYADHREGLYWPPKNEYEIPQETKETVDLIRSLTEEEQPLAAVTGRLISWVRQYDPGILLIYGQFGRSYSEDGKALYREMTAETPDLAAIGKLAASLEVDFIAVLAEDVTGTGPDGYTEVGRTATDPVIILYGRNSGSSE